MSQKLIILLTHQPDPVVSRMAAWWQEHIKGGDLLIVYGGSRERYEALEAPAKTFVDDPRLRTRDHQRERQSYAGVFQAAADWLRDRPQYRRLLFAEFDCIPLRRDFLDLLDECMDREDADLLGCGVTRVDGTQEPHYLYHAGDAGFHGFLKQLSVRRDTAPVLTMLGSVSFWRREAFEAVAAVRETLPVYLELALPTWAHHLGFRVRDFGNQSRWVQPTGNFLDRLESVRSAGAWMIHPVKGFWEQPDLPPPASGRNRDD